MINYRTRRDYCHCCDRKLDNPKLSEIREFRIDKDDVLSWTEWKVVIEYDDIKYMVREFVCDTIRFFATNFDDKLLIEKSEFDKVIEFIKSIVKEEDNE